MHFKLGSNSNNNQNSPANGGKYSMNNWSQDDKAFFYSMQVPGSVEDNFDIQLVGNKLIVKYQNQTNQNSSVQQPLSSLGQQAGTRGSYSQENYSQYLSEFFVPQDRVKTEDIKALLKDGVLTISFPKKYPGPDGQLHRKIEFVKNKL